MELGRLAGVLVLALLAGGCTALEAPRPALEFAPPEPLARGSVLLPVPEEIPRERLPVRVVADPVWVRPSRNVTAFADAPLDAGVVWFVGVQGDDVRVTWTNGHAYLTRASTPLHDGPRATPRAPLEVELRPAQGPTPLLLERPGRLQLGLSGGGALLNVTILPHAPPGAPSQSFLAATGSGFRMVPDELEVRAGTRVLLWNAADAPQRLVERSFAALLAEGVREVDVTPADDGLFTFEAVAHGHGRAMGAGRARVLSDFERPSDVAAVPHVSGTFGAGERAREMPVRAAYPVEEMALSIRVGTSFPPPGAVRVSLLHEGRELASAASGEGDGLRAKDLPAGDLVIRVEAAAEGLVSYDVRGTMRYALPVPDAVRD